MHFSVFFSLTPQIYLLKAYRHVGGWKFEELQKFEIIYHIDCWDMYDNITPGVQWTPGVRHKVKIAKKRILNLSRLSYVLNKIWHGKVYINWTAINPGWIMSRKFPQLPPRKFLDIIHPWLFAVQLTHTQGRLRPGVDWAAGTPGRFPVGRQDRWY